MAEVYFAHELLHIIGGVSRRGSDMQPRAEMLKSDKEMVLFTILSFRESVFLVDRENVKRPVRGKSRMVRYIETGLAF